VAVLCVTLNSAVDRTLVVRNFQLNHIHRPEKVIVQAGGKGFNVARALNRLGTTPLVTGWTGGYAGQFIEHSLHKEGIGSRLVHLEVETRTCISVVDPDNQTITELYENGETIPPEACQNFLECYTGILAGCQAVALSGSLPAGVPSDFFGTLVRCANDAGVPAFLDTHGSALIAGMAARPAVVKPNQQEFSACIERELNSQAEVVQAALQAAGQYNTTVVVSMGSMGVIAATAEGKAWQAVPPPVTAVSAVGSGDCFLAGLIHAWIKQEPFENALQAGVAAGAANALTVGAGQFRYEDYLRIYPQVSVKLIRS